MLMSDLSSSVSMAALTAGENLSLGSPVSLAADGTLYGVVDPNNPANIPAWRPMNQANTAYAVPLSSTSAYSVSSRTTQSNSTNLQCFDTSCQLTNGNIAKCYSQTGSPYNIYIAVFDQHGDTVLPETIVSAGISTSPGYTNICALTGGGFAVSYYNSSGFLTFQTFTAAGVSTGSFVTSVSSNKSVAMDGLSNGSFAVSYVGGGVFAGIFSSICAQVMAITQISAISTSQVSVGQCALTGGGVVFYYIIGTSGSVSAFQIYSNTGTQTLAQTVVPIVGNTSIYLNCVALTGGGFAVSLGDTNTASTGVTAAVYNAAGAQQGANIVLSTTATGNAQPWMCASSGGSVYIAYMDTNLKVAKIGANGVQIGSTITPTTAASPGNPATIVPDTADGCLFLHSSGSNPNVYGVPLTSALAQQYPAFTISVPNNPVVIGAFVAAAGVYSPTMTFTLAMEYNSGTYLNWYAYRVQKAQVIGVTQAAVTSGNPANMQFVGKINLGTAFVQPYEVVTAANNVLTVVGNRAEITKLAPTKETGYIGAVSGSGSVTFTAPTDCMVSINWTASAASGTVQVNNVPVGGNTLSTSQSTFGVATVYMAASTSITILASATGVSFVASFVEV